jgi:type VI secretion system protein ImpD
LSQVAAAAFAPVVIGAHPSLFGLDSFSELGQPLDLGAIFRTPEYSRWASFQDTEDARFVGVVLPGILMRLPYSDDGVRRDGFRFREGNDRPDHESYVWGNGAYAFAAVVMRAYRNYGWFADIRGARVDGEGGGMVTGLPSPAFATDRWEGSRRRPVEAEITDAQEQALSNLGFISLSPCRYSPNLVFLGNQSLQRVRGDEGIAAANARLGTMLQYMLCISRLALHQGHCP